MKQTMSKVGAWFAGVLESRWAGWAWWLLMLSSLGLLAWQMVTIVGSVLFTVYLVMYTSGALVVGVRFGRWITQRYERASAHRRLQEQHLRFAAQRSRMMIEAWDRMRVLGMARTAEEAAILLRQFYDEDHRMVRGDLP